MQAMGKVVRGLVVSMIAVAGFACGSASESERTSENGSPLAASSPACVSQEDGPCGGFTTHACTCAPGLYCKANPIPDIPGTCEPARCCPTGWDIYSCHEENGTTGFNCHNPLLGCASSLVCNGGCDFQVTGRCPVCDPVVCPPGQKWDVNLCKCD
jgi:hypothetical protein